ncbi:MAG: hypothetical protein ACREBT_06545 [Thermoplasmata archaeon]
MTPATLPPSGLSAPGLIGPVSILNWPVAGPRGTRRHRSRPYSHIHLEIDLRPESIAKVGGAIRRIEKALGELEVVESEDLLRLTGVVLHAFASVGFVRIFHWEAEPGGWLPLPHGRDGASEEPLGHFLRALDSEEWKATAKARSFALRLGATGNMHADVVVRRIHRERRHTISIDLRGSVPGSQVKDLVGAIHQRATLDHATVTQVAYAET